jgi:hypothetical protein
MIFRSKTTGQEKATYKLVLPSIIKKSYTYLKENSQKPVENWEEFGEDVEEIFELVKTQPRSYSKSNLQFN